MSNAKRRTYSAEPGRVEVREPTDDDGSDGLFRIRMPVSSTMEARDGEAFTRDRLEGWTRQIEAGDVGVFLDHGRSVGESRYSALGKLGYWDDPDELRDNWRVDREFDPEFRAFVEECPERLLQKLLFRTEAPGPPKEVDISLDFTHGLSRFRIPITVLELIKAGWIDYRYAESHRTGFFWLPQSLHSNRSIESIAVSKLSQFEQK